jgi:hypothetical protein
LGIRIRIGKKKQNKIDNKKRELIKELDEHIRWIKEEKIKKEKEKKD